MDCYLCQNQMELFLNKNGYDIFTCPMCGLKATKLNQPYESFVKSFYSQGYFTGVAKYGAYANYVDDKWYIVQNMKKFLRNLKQYKPSGRLLDVGCAMGFFVELTLLAGYDSYGLEPSKFAVDRVKQLLKERIQEGSINTSDYPKHSFDVITMFDVIEHLGDPGKDIEKLKTYLKDDGIFIMATGNADSFAAKSLGRRWPFYTPPQHLFFFTKKTFSMLLTKHGLTPIFWFGIGKWLSIRYFLQIARSNAESKFAKLLYPLIKSFHLDWIPIYLFLGDNMVVIAEKTQNSSLRSGQARNLFKK